MYLILINLNGFCCVIIICLDFHGLILVKTLELKTTYITSSPISVQPKPFQAMKMISSYNTICMHMYIGLEPFGLWCIYLIDPWPLSSLQDVGKLDWVEFFAGQAQATRMFKVAGFRTAKLDLGYMTACDGSHQNPMDLTTDAGMAPLGLHVWSTVTFWLASM